MFIYIYIYIYILNKINENDCYYSLYRIQNRFVGSWTFTPINTYFNNNVCLLITLNKIDEITCMWTHYCCVHFFWQYNWISDSRHVTIITFIRLRMYRRNVYVSGRTAETLQRRAYKPIPGSCLDKRGRYWVGFIRWVSHLWLDPQSNPMGTSWLESIYIQNLLTNDIHELNVWVCCGGKKSFIYGGF